MYVVVGRIFGTLLRNTQPDGVTLDKSNPTVD
jgi:hypothetical protein